MAEKVIVQCSFILTIRPQSRKPRGPAGQDTLQMQINLLPQSYSSGGDHKLAMNHNDKSSVTFCWPNVPKNNAIHGAWRHIILPFQHSADTHLLEKEMTPSKRPTITHTICKAHRLGVQGSGTLCRRDIPEARDLNKTWWVISHMWMKLAVESWSYAEYMWAGGHISGTADTCAEALTVSGSSLLLM